MDIEKYFIEFIKQNNEKLENYIISSAKQYSIPYLDELKAQFLETAVKIKSPEKTLEIGLGSGYSTYKILKSLPTNGQLISIDYNFWRVEFFYENIFSKFSESLKNRVNVFPVDSFYALDLFININERFDFIFIDAMKKDYILYLDKVENLLNIGGVLIFDNITYNKQLINLEIKRSENYIKGINLVNKFNQKLIGNKKFITSFITIGDGLSFSVKIK